MATIQCNECGKHLTRRPSEISEAKNPIVCSTRCAASQRTKGLRGTDPAISRFVKATWTAMNLRCANGRYRHDTSKNAAYANVLIEMTREEFKRWCFEHSDEIRQLARPSIDRKEKTLGYTLENIRVCELAENIRKDKTVFVDGLGRCYRCKGRKPETEFVADRRRANGRASICKACEVLRTKQKAIRSGVYTGLGRWPKKPSAPAGSTGR